ncbi:MAG: SDR family oxidoreductase [Pirellulaceae bacterium]|jgi:3-oxoacyl-[acyl-carrier protein] reductase|nr:SDR family oxidoreductase [Pirellulaceae bacterium]MDP7018402.1 SDR family oxidoreductase [Pirellulaceae bacterium]
MANDFSQKHVLITGGTRGIGLACALRLAGEGARLTLNYHSREDDAHQAVAAVEAAGGQAFAVAGDVSQPGEVQRFVGLAREQFGPVEMLVASAGVSFPMPASDVTWEVWKKTLDVNLDGVFNAVYGVIEEMIERRFGRIVTISSIAGLREREQQMPYSVSKAGVIAMTRCCAEAWGPHNVRINCVSPGLTETEMAHTLSPEVHEAIISATPLRRIGQPHETAALIRFLLSEESSYTTGQTMVASGGRVMLPG